MEKLKKYYSFFVIAICTTIFSFILTFENKEKKENIESEKDNRLIFETLSKNYKLILKNQIIIPSSEFCYWQFKNDVACGIYCKKNRWPKIILKDTELNIEWVTNKKVLLPGLVFTSEKDTTICAKTSSGKEIYIVMVSGKNIKLINNYKRTHYYGDVVLSNMEDLKNYFDLKIQ